MEGKVSVALRMACVIVSEVERVTMPLEELFRHILSVEAEKGMASIIKGHVLKP